ncbi:hypothetical protein SALBM311S_12449 [Streptomyces alboniger]
MTCWRVTISRSASASRKPPGASAPGTDTAAGHSATTSDSPPVRVVHSVSVTNGTTGCSSFSVTSRTSPRTRLLTSAASPPAWNVVFDSSTYQSKTSSHAKWKSVSDNFANW